MNLILFNFYLEFQKEIESVPIFKHNIINTTRRITQINNILYSFLNENFEKNLLI